MFNFNLLIMLKNYVLRHQRLNLVTDDPVVEDPVFHDVVESVPLLDDKGEVVIEQQVFTKKLASEFMKPYKISDFKLENLIAAGVPLKEIDIDYNPSSRNEMVLLKAKELKLLSDSLSVYEPIGYSKTSGNATEPSTNSNVEPSNNNSNG